MISKVKDTTHGSRNTGHFRVRPELREKIPRYYRKCFDLLAQAVTADLEQSLG